MILGCEEPQLLPPALILYVSFQMSVAGVSRPSAPAVAGDARRGTPVHCPAGQDTCGV